MSDLFERAAAYCTDLQERILSALEELDGGRFRVDDWSRGAPRPLQGEDGPWLGGFGRTRVLEGGRVLEKAGVNFSQVDGRFSIAHAKSMPGSGRAFRATGISLVLHPRSPHIPTVHMNLRRISRTGEDGQELGWFGGGADLTPYYLVEEDCRHFHRTLATACQAHPEVADYPRFKDACDRYFHLPHRGEARGVGGVFFDHLMEQPDATFAFLKTLGDAFLPAWLPIARAHLDDPVSDSQRDWQLIRRGRYVEFNLVHDRGTSFGLKTGGRTESILMSLPSSVRWAYDHRPPAGSAESALLELVSGTPRQWLDPDEAR